MAVELGLLEAVGTIYRVKNSLCRFLCSSDQATKATILRIALEMYGPFITFRERWLATAGLTRAAHQTAQIHVIALNKDAIRDTLVNLGTFAGILLARTGGQYELTVSPTTNWLNALAVPCQEVASAEQRARIQLGQAAASRVSQVDVVNSLTTAFIRCATPGNGRESVLTAGNAVESFLFQEGTRLNLNAPSFRMPSSISMEI